MRKDKEIEESQDGHKARLHQKAEKHIQSIEDIIEALMAGVEMSDLSSKERLNMAARFATLYQHAILVDDSLTVNQGESREDVALEFIMKRMRGENGKEKPRIVDAEITPYPEIEDNDQED